MPDDKQVLRARLKARRRTLAREQAAGLSEAIAGRVLGYVLWPQVRSLHAYWPMSREREVDTRRLLQIIWQRYPYIRTATWQDGGRGGAVWIGADGTGGAVASGQQFDIVLVPLLGFSAQLHRIGFGGGFYDRFLAQQSAAYTIGLGYAFGQVAFTPEAHDIPLNAIITEGRLICRNKAHSGTITL